ncbi:MAG: O-antigen ligase family protein [Planctomycetia bacterium]
MTPAGSVSTDHAAPAGSAAASASCGWGAIAIVAWLGLLLVGLNVVHDPTVHDKTLVPRLHALVIVMLAAMPTLVLPRVAGRIDRSVLREPVILCAIGYAACTAASLLVTVNPTAGLIDLVRTGAVALVLVVACLLLPLVPRWPDQLLRWLVVGALVTATLGWVELGTRHGVGLHPRRMIEDVSGRMGNVNLLSGYLVEVLPGCLAAACLLRGPWRLLGIVASTAGLGLVVLLQSRSAWVGLVAGAAVAAAMAWVWRRPLGLGPRFGRLLAAGGLVAVCGVAGWAWFAGPDDPVAARLRSLVAARDADGRLSDGGRTMIWRLTARMIADHPLAGVGAGNFPLRLPEYHAAPEADMAALHTDTWSRPHNDFLQVAAEKGLPGLAVFAGMFTAALASIVATMRRPASVRDGRLAGFLGMAVVSYLAFSCFDFPLERVSHQVTLAVLLAAATVLRRQAVPAADSTASTAMAAAVTAAALCLTVAAAWTTAALEQERSAVAARAAVQSGRFDVAVGFARRATTPWRTLDALGVPVAYYEGVALMQLGDPVAATACLERARRDHPGRFAVLNNLGILYATAGRTDEAIECFTAAVTLFPHRPEGFVNLAGCYLDADRPGDAVDLLERVPESQRTAVMQEHLDRGRAMLGRPAEPATD